MIKVNSIYPPSADATKTVIVTAALSPLYLHSVIMIAFDFTLPIRNDAGFSPSLLGALSLKNRLVCGLFIIPGGIKGVDVSPKTHPAGGT